MCAAGSPCGQLACQPRRLLAAARIAQKAVDVENAGAREHALPTDVAELPAQIVQQLALEIVDGTEIDVAAFARERAMRPAVEVESGLAEAGTR